MQPFFVYLLMRAERNFYTGLWYALFFLPLFWRDSTRKENQGGAPASAELTLN